jgi:hypothetical protein
VFPLILELNPAVFNCLRGGVFCGSVFGCYDAVWEWVVAGVGGQGLLPGPEEDVEEEKSNEV